MDVPLAYRQKDILRRVIRRYGLGPRYVELGCGDGFTMELFDELGMEGTGVDYSPEAIRIAESKAFSKAKFIEGDFFDLDLKNETLIFLLNVLEHFEDDQRVLALINNFLAVDGHLVLALPAHSKAYGPGDKIAGHYRRYDRKELEEKLAGAGFEVIVVYSIGFPIGNLYTWGYNQWLKLLKTDETLEVENTKLTGMKDEVSHFPRPIQLVSKIAFPILRFLISCDFPFHRSDLGNNYLLLARKIRTVHPVELSESKPALSLSWRREPTA